VRYDFPQVFERAKLTSSRVKTLSRQLVDALRSSFALRSAGAFCLAGDKSGFPFPVLAEITFAVVFLCSPDEGEGKGGETKGAVD